jgi:TetR/AcrR family transcriptional regulator
MKSIKEKQREWKKNEIINAVIDLCLEKGIVDVSIEEIAKKSGFGSSSIYYYFKSKEDIIKEILISGWKKMISKMKTINLDYDKPYESLIEVIKTHLEFTKENPKLFKFISKFTKAFNNKEIRKLINQENEIYYSLIEACINKNILKGDLKFIYNSLAGSVKQIAQNEELTIEEKLNYIIENLNKFK